MGHYPSTAAAELFEVGQIDKHILHCFPLSPVMILWVYPYMVVIAFSFLLEPSDKMSYRDQ